MEEIKAGPELDAIIAEKVMEWKLRNDEWLDGERVTIWRTDRPCFLGDWEHWNPSTNIAAAWEVVQKLPIPFQIVQMEKDKWEVLMMSVGRSVADTAPLAICLAALEAVRKKLAFRISCG